MNATLENPLVAERNEDGRGAYEIFADSSGSPAGFTQFFTYTDGGVKQRLFPHTVVKEEFGWLGAGVQGADVPKTIGLCLLDSVEPLNRAGQVGYVGYGGEFAG